MKMLIIGIYDRKAQMFISLEPTPSIGVTLRSLTEQVNQNKESPLYKWPEDYALWHLGEWDNENGTPYPLIEGEGDRKGPGKKLIIECEQLKTK